MIIIMELMIIQATNQAAAKVAFATTEVELGTVRHYNN